MLRRCLLSIVLVLITQPAIAAPADTWQELTPEARTADPGYRVQMHRAGPDRVKLVLEIDGFNRQAAGGDSRFQAISLPRAGSLRRTGMPALPVLVRRLTGARGHSPEILRITTDTVRIPNVIPEPFTPRPYRCQGEWPSRRACDARWYSEGDAWPAEWAQVRRTGLLRSVPISEVSFQPFRYHPRSRELEIARRMEITLALPAIRPEELPDRAHSEPFRAERLRLLMDPPIDLREGPKTPERLLILAADDLIPALDEFIAWKRLSGLAVDLVALSEVGDTHQDVAAWISDRYFNDPVAPTYILLVGDGEGQNKVPWVPSPYGCASDFLYSTLEGDDLYSDVLIGRISAHTVAEAQLQADKMVWYESQLTAATGAWLPNSICISSSEGSGGSNDDVRSDIICGDQAEHGYTTQKFYHSMGNDTAGNISAAIDQGLGWITYLGHGSGTAWATTNPHYSNNHIANLENSFMLPFIMDVSCSNGGFNGQGGDCMAEAWLKTGEPGDLRAAVGSYSASTPTPWDEPAEMAVGFTEGVLDQGILRWAEACMYGRSYMMEVLPGGSIEEVSHQYVVFGDPSLLLRTQVPTALAIDAPDAVPVGIESLAVTVTAGEQPAAQAKVVLELPDGGLAAGQADDAGQVTLPLSVTSPGELTIHAVAPNSTPAVKTVQVTATGCGFLSATPQLTTCTGEIEVKLFDQDLNQDPALAETVQIFAAAGLAGLEVTLTEDGPDSSKFTGLLSLGAAPGELSVSDGDPVALSYQDAACDGAPNEVSLEIGVDCLGPAIEELVISGLTATGATVNWTTSEPAAGEVRYGTDAPPQIQVGAPGQATEHGVLLEGLAPATSYLLEIRAWDPAGNLAVDDNEGQWYGFETLSCTPSCEGKQCGDDGCGGACGQCCPGQECKDGQCLGGPGCEESGASGCGGCPCEECVCQLDAYCCESAWDDICVDECITECGGCQTEGDCADKECGDDGCGGSCWTGNGPECGDTEICIDGLCQTPCVGDCDGKDCGDDGCGQSCGQCPEGSSCGDDGLCHDPCDGITFEGCCDGDVLYYCDGGVTMNTDCGEQGLTCGWKPGLGWYDCAEAAAEDPSGDFPLHCPGVCLPDCGERVCGDDGCGGSCWTSNSPECGDAEICIDGQCEFPCEGIPPAGCCDGTILDFCDPVSGLETETDCSDEGLVCGWDPELGWYSCVAQVQADPSGENPMWCPGTCVPDCEGLECGGDGCGGSCGACVPGFECTAGQCSPVQAQDDVVAEPVEPTTFDRPSSSSGCSHGPPANPLPLLLALLLGLFLRRRAASM